MIKLSENENLYLVGFMAAGKSTIGAVLATRLRRSFIDTDRIIAQTYGTSISEIFSKSGEPFFRQIETRILQDTASQTGVLVALGGGTLQSAENRELVKNSGKSIYLQWSFKRLLRNLKRNGRPLALAKNNWELRDLFETRKRYYETADLVLNCDMYENPDEITEQIVNQIEKN